MLSHIDKNNNPTMVDVSEKQVSLRIAEATCLVELPDIIMSRLKENEIIGPKGPVFQTAIIAGSMAAKNTYNLIPFCHPIGLESCKIKIEVIGENQVEIISQLKVTSKTGVEMEALVACSVAALTIYDMCKAMSHEIVIKETRLLKKRGGKSEFEK